MLVVCDECNREGPPNVSPATLEQLGWRIRRKNQPEVKRDLCPSC